MENREYQEKAEQSILDAYDQGHRRLLLSMATGTGKTIVFSKLYEKLKSRLPGQMLILAHREELIDQAIDKMHLVNPDLKIDKEKAQHHADPSTADVIVASVATLGRKGTKRVGEYNWERVDKVITDEAHHSTADSYRNVYMAADVLNPHSHKLLLGVTATPNRADGAALSDIYQKIVQGYSLRQAITDGWLVDLKSYRVQTFTKLDNVKTVAGDFQQDQLAEVVDAPSRNAMIVEAWMQLGEGRQTVAFTVGIGHAQNLAAMFQQNGINADAVWGDDPDRAAKIKAHQAGEITVLCNCGVLTEGYDDWRIGCILMARPTKSPILFTQMIGRGTRLQDNTGNLKLITNCGEYSPADLKLDCIVIDVVDNSTRHSLVTLPSLMGLSGGLNLRGELLVESVDTLEAAQALHENVDFSKLTDIANLTQLIEQTNLFDIRFPAEVEANSELKWVKAIDGGYRMTLPKSQGGTIAAGWVTIKQNLLDLWEVEGYYDNRAFHGNRPTIEDAFVAADEQIRQRVQSLTLLKRTASWHGNPATSGQLGLLKKLYPYKEFPADLTKGLAALWIDKRIGKKA